MIKNQLIELINSSDIGEKEINDIYRKVLKYKLQALSREVIQRAQKDLKDHYPARASVLTAAITLKERDIAKALQEVIVNKIYKDHYDRSLFDLFEAALRAGNLEQARKITSEIYLREIDGKLSAAKKFITIAGISYNGQDIESARNAMLAVGDYGAINNTLPEIVDFSIKIGNIEEAKKTAIAMTSKFRCVVSLLKIFQITKDRLYIDYARQAALEAEVHDSYFGHNQAEAYLEIFEQSHEVQDLDKACEAAAKIDYMSHRIDCFLNIAVATKEYSDFEKVTSIASEIEDDYDRNKKLRMIIEELIKCGLFELARKAVSHMGGYDDQSDTFIMIANSSHEEQDFRKALTVLDNVPEPLNWRKEQCLLNIMSALANT